MSKDSGYTVMIGPPGPNFGWNSVQALLALTNSKHTVKFVHSGNGWDDFDSIWVDALNASEAGFITHFAMLHLDVAPKVGDGEPVWLDVLIEELDRLDLAMVSAVIPLKDMSGVTSSGIGDPSNPWEPYRRFTIRELANFPQTFNAADVGYPGYPLLHNTGCWVCDLRKPEFHQADEEGTCRAFFGFPQRVHRNPLTGQWMLSRESEDWFFSRHLHALAAKTAITRKVKLTHQGKAGFKNWDSWGTSEHDDTTAYKWAVPRGPWDAIQGWFDFADVYQEAVDRAQNGAHFVEVGSWLGKSAVFMADAIRRSGKSIRFDCIDNWAGGGTAIDNGMAAAANVAESHRDLYAEFMANIRKYGAVDIVNAIRCDSTEAAARYATGSLDFVFIDANHAEESVARDLNAWRQKLKPAGTLAGHDYNEPGPKAAADSFAAKLGLSISKRLRSFVIVDPRAGDGKSVATSCPAPVVKDALIGNTSDYQWV